MEQIAAYWDRRPCNVRHSDEPVDSLAYSLQVTARKQRVEPHLWQFADFSAWSGASVLDLGCGIGTEALEFARYGANVTAVDLSARSLDITRTRFDSEGLRADFILGNMETDLNMAGSFDLVWAWGTLHHTPDPLRVLTLARSYLRPGGWLRVMLYHRLSTKALRLWLQAGCPRDLDAAVAIGSEAQEGCPLTRTYTRGTACDLLKSAGFKVTAVQVCHIFPWRVADYVQGRYVRGWPWRVLPESWVAPLLGWHLLVEGSA